MQSLLQTTRRRFLAALGALVPFGLARARQGAPSELVATPDYFADLGVKPFINAIGPYSSLGGAEMWPEVIEAMDYAVHNKARMTDLHDAVGQRIAELTGAEAALVSSGATGAIILATAACMTRGDAVRMEQLPDTREMPNEVIILKGQRYLYDRSIKAPGAVLVEAETLADVRAAVNDRTAMMFYLANRPGETEVVVADYIALAHELDVPIMCDAATTVPPVANIPATVAAGFDLICYSGGKGLRGPYSAGLLLGRKDLIDYARQHGSPNHRAYGRSMKVAPEEYLGMMVAVETSLKFDEEAEYARQYNTVNAMARDLDMLDGVTVSIEVPDAEAREPYVEVRWDEHRYPISVADMKQSLRSGEPSIEVRGTVPVEQPATPHCRRIETRRGCGRYTTCRRDLAAKQSFCGRDAMIVRRSFLKGLASALPFAATGTVSAQQQAAPARRDYFKELGVKPFINAAGAYSAYGGARMRPEVVHAMRYAATRKVKMRELHDAVGERIASLAGSEAAMVTSGATASIVLGVAACMTGDDEDKMRQLPDTHGMRNEVIIQKKHRYTYDRALTVPGSVLVEVESEADVRRLAGERTAMMFFLKPTQKGDDIPAPQFIALARELRIPSFCDAATTTPPAMNVVDGVSEGFDLICYSGGKGLPWSLQYRTVAGPSRPDRHRETPCCTERHIDWARYESFLRGVPGYAGRPRNGFENLRGR